MTTRVLLVEDDPSLATVICEALREEGHHVVACAEVARRDALLDEERYDVMLTDVGLADGDGLSTMAQVRARAPTMPVIVLSAQNGFDTALRASECEVFEYLPKPFDIDELLRAVAQAIAHPGQIVPEPAVPVQDLPLVGNSQAMQKVYRLITRVLRNDLTVLVSGESGTGKEQVAEAIHTLGSRSTGPFVAINAAAIPRDLIESELFGHEKGAFTGAVAQAIGKFEQAQGGTLFLDEIGDMSAEAQTRLLRTLQSGRIRRVGGRHEIAVDVRIIAATNRPLQPMIAAGTFREDLFYRLNVVPIHLPPLRERSTDIAPLVWHFLAQAEAESLPRRTITTEALEALAARQWRGNVRELRNAVFRLAVLARTNAIDAILVDEVLGHADEPDSGGPPSFGDALHAWLERDEPTEGTLHRRAIAELERPLFAEALTRTGGNQVAAARLLGINRNTLRKRLADLASAGPDPD